MKIKQKKILTISSLVQLCLVFPNILRTIVVNLFDLAHCAPGLIDKVKYTLTWRFLALAAKSRQRYASRYVYQIINQTTSLNHI